MKLILGFFFGLEIESEEDLANLKGPLIIVSNHGSWIDPFLIGVVFPFNAKVFPIHYAALYKLFYIPVLTPFLWGFGCFSIKRGIGLEFCLKSAVKILKNKGIIGMFPEGRRQRKGQGLSRPKRGAAFLSLTTGTKLLPVKIEGNISMVFSKFLLGKYKVKIKIGKTFSLAPQETNPPELLNQPADYIMEKIRQL